MKKVVDIAKAIAGKEKIPLYLPKSEIRRLDREKAVDEGYNAGIKKIKQKQTEMIINMYKNKLDIKTISKYANIFLEEVENIINNKN